MSKNRRPKQVLVKHVAVRVHPTEVPLSPYSQPCTMRLALTPPEVDLVMLALKSYRTDHLRSTRRAARRATSPAARMTATRRIFASYSMMINNYQRGSDQRHAVVACSDRLANLIHRFDLAVQERRKHQCDDPECLCQQDD